MFLDKKKRNLLYLCAYVLFVYATLPFGPDVWKFICKIIGRDQAWVISFIIAAIIGIAVLSYLIFSRKEKRPFVYAAFVAIGVAYILGMRMVRLPAEKLHFLEYTGVAYFSLRLYSEKMKPYLISIPLIFLIGLIDEGIQYILPNRVFEIHDVLTNFVGGILGLMLIRFVIRARGVK